MTLFNAAIDLDEYFARIGYAGERTPLVQVLADIHRLHAANIPFENLDPLLGRGVSLVTDDIARKLVARKRGGYCFEHNALLGTVLKQLGFAVTGLSARVLRAVGPGVIPARTHMALRVVSEGVDYIADVGFGGQTMSGPLKLFERGVQQTPHEPYRLDEANGDYTLNAELAGEWRALYRFTLEESGPADYEVANFYTACSPASPFTSRLMAARAALGKRLGLLNNQLSIHTQAGTEKRVLMSAEELAKVLEEDFGILLPAPREDTLKALAKLV